jgi:hypothetical protein
MLTEIYLFNAASAAARLIFHDFGGRISKIYRRKNDHSLFDNVLKEFVNRHLGLP